MVSARKTKARLNKSVLARLKKKNAESQAKEMELSPEALGRIGDELVSATIQGFNEELAASPAPIRALAKQFSGLIEEFFKGFKEGVDAELKEFVKNNRKISETTIEDIEKVTTTNIKALAETITDVVPEKAAAPTLTKEKTNEAVSSILARKEGNAGSVLDKKTNLKDFLTRAAFGAIGQEDAGEAVISKRQEKEAFIQTETKLRSEEFKGMSSEDVRTKLEEDYKTIQTTTSELKKLEEKISTYKDMGYSPAQMEKLGVDEKKKELVQQAIKADPSRMEQYTKYIEGDTTTTNNTRQPTTTISNTDTGTRITNFKDESVKTQSTSALEENIQEQNVIQEKTAEEQSKQSTLLSEIRDLLKAQKEEKQKEDKGNKEDDQGGGDGGGIDIDLPGRRGRRGRAPRTGGVGKAMRGMASRALPLAKAAAPWALAAGAAVVAGNVVDTGLGAMGVGKDKEGNALAIDEKQDDENWNKATFGEKIGSGVARGIEKVGSFLGLDNMVTQARADRIKNETEYLKKKNATVEDTKKSIETTVDVKFNEEEFSQKDPDSYKKFVQFRTERIQQIAIDLSKQFNRTEPTPADRQVARSQGHKEAIEKFKKEIETAGVGAVKGGTQTPEKTSTAQKTPAEAKQEAQIDKTVSGATPPDAAPAGAPNAPPGVPATEGRKIADIAKPIGTAAVTVPAQPPRDLVKTPDGSFAPGAPAATPATGPAKETVQISFSQATFSKNDPENYQKFVKELDSRTETLTEKYFSSGRFGKSEQAKERARMVAETVAKKETILKFKKEIEAAGAGAVTVTKEGATKEQPASIEKTAGTTVPEQTPNQPPEAKQIPPGAPNAPPGTPAAPAKAGFFSNLVNKVKNFFGMGTPTVEPGKAEQAPAQLTGAKAAAGPNWSARLAEYDKSPNDTPAANLEKQYPGITKEFIAIAKESLPRTDLPQSIETHEQMLITKAIKKMSGTSDAAVPMEKAASGVPGAPSEAWQPATGAPKPAGVLKLQALQEEAKKQGIAGKVSGTFEGGVLTGITDEAGKNYPVEVKEADKRNVEIARSMRAANDNSANLQQAVIDRESAQPKQMSPTLKQAPVDATAMNAAAAMGKNITIQSPPPVVVPAGGGGGGQTIMSQPFTSNVRNSEPTLNKYLAARYVDF